MKIGLIARALLVTVAAASLMGCASNKPAEPAVYEHATQTFLPRSFAPTLELKRSPEVGADAIANLGVSMISVSRITSFPALSVAGPIRHVIPWGSERIAIDMPVPASGALPQVGVSPDGGRFYSGGSGAFSYQNRNGSFGRVDHTAPAGLFVSTAGAVHVYWKWPDHPLFISPAPELRARPIDHLVGAEDALRRELVYGGSTDNTVSILYREFLNDMARPAFSQELRYDLSKGRVIGYKGARFEVLRADNTGITYRVITPMD
jgi:hypothetical protein